MTGRVVVTGIGAVTAVGHTAEDTWQAMLAGRSGIGPITLFDPEPYPVRIQAEVKGFELGDRVDAKQQRYMNRGVTFGVSAALEALADSELSITEENADMIGVIFSAGGGGTDMVVEHQHILETKGPRRITPFESTMNGAAVCSTGLPLASSSSSTPSTRRRPATRSKSR